MAEYYGGIKENTVAVTMKEKLWFLSFSVKIGVNQLDVDVVVCDVDLGETPVEVVAPLCVKIEGQLVANVVLEDFVPDIYC